MKTRLQTTSLPFPVSQESPRRDQGITAGILDIDSALLDPGSDWIKINGSDWKAVRVRRWNGALEIQPSGKSACVWMTFIASKE